MWEHIILPEWNLELSPECGSFSSAIVPGLTYLLFEHGQFERRYLAELPDAEGDRLAWFIGGPWGNQLRRVPPHWLRSPVVHAAEPVGPYTTGPLDVAGLEYITIEMTTMRVVDYWRVAPLPTGIPAFSVTPRPD